MKCLTWLPFYFYEQCCSSLPATQDRTGSVALFYLQGLDEETSLACASERPVSGTFLTPGRDVTCPSFPHPLPLGVLICSKTVGIAWSPCPQSMASACLEVEKSDVFIALGLLAQCWLCVYGLTGSWVLISSAEFYLLCEAEGDHSDTATFTESLLCACTA